MNILIAEDDDLTRSLLSSVLTKLGHNVRATANGRDAWEAWRTGDFPFIISDWMMPDFDGIELCRRVRAEPRVEYTFIVLLTSRFGKTDYPAAMSAGVDDFITKPLEKDEFAARVRIGERILGLHTTLRAANNDLDRRVAERTAVIEAANRTRAEFFSRAGHELRTPVLHILGSAERLESAQLDLSQRDCVAQILASGTVLMSVIERFLASPEPRFGDPGCFRPGGSADGGPSPSSA